MGGEMDSSRVQQQQQQQVPSSPHEKKASKAKKQGLGSAILIGIVFVCFANTLVGEFQCVDYDRVLHNPDVKGTSPGGIWSIFSHDSLGHPMSSKRSNKDYAPLPLLSLRLTHAIFGFRPFFFHLFNVVLHGLNVLLVFRLCLSTLVVAGKKKKKSGGGKSSVIGIHAGLVGFLFSNKRAAPRSSSSSSASETAASSLSSNNNKKGKESSPTAATKKSSSSPSSSSNHHHRHHHHHQGAAAVDSTFPLWGNDATFFISLLGSALFAAHPLVTDAVSMISGRSFVLATFFALKALSNYIHSARKSSTNFPALFRSLGFVWLCSMSCGAYGAMLIPILIAFDVFYPNGNVIWRHLHGGMHKRELSVLFSRIGALGFAALAFMIFRLQLEAASVHGSSPANISPISNPLIVPSADVISASGGMTSADEGSSFYPSTLVKKEAPILPPELLKEMKKMENPTYSRGLTLAFIAGYALKMMFLPVFFGISPLISDYSYETLPLVSAISSLQVLLSLLLLVAVAVLFVLSFILAVPRKFSAIGKQNPSLFFFLFVVLVSYFPFSHFLWNHHSLFEERSMYFAAMAGSVALAMILGGGGGGGEKGGEEGGEGKNEQAQVQQHYISKKMGVVLIVLFAVFLSRSVIRNQNYSTFSRLTSSDVASAPKNSFLRVCEGLMHMKAENWEDAEHSFEKAVSLSPRSPIALLNYGKMLITNNNQTHAVDVLNRALAVDAEDVGALETLSQLLSDTGRHEEALSPLHSLATLKPSSDNYLKLGIALFHSGRYSRAAAALSSSISSLPTDLPPAPLPYLYYSLTSAALRELPEAKSAVEFLQAHVQTTMDKIAKRDPLKQKKTKNNNDNDEENNGENESEDEYDKTINYCCGEEFSFSNVWRRILTVRGQIATKEKDYPTALDMFSRALREELVEGWNEEEKEQLERWKDAADLLALDGDVAESFGFAPEVEEEEEDEEEEEEPEPVSRRDRGSPRVTDQARGGADDEWEEDEEQQQQQQQQKRRAASSSRGGRKNSAKGEDDTLVTPPAASASSLDWDEEEEAGTKQQQQQQQQKKPAGKSDNDWEDDWAN